MLPSLEDQIAALAAELELVKARQSAIEANDKIQTKRLDDQRKAMGIFAGLLCIGAVLSGYSFSNPENKATVEGIAISIISSSLIGVLGVPFIQPKAEQQ